MVLERSATRPLLCRFMRPVGYSTPMDYDSETGVNRLEDGRPAALALDVKTSAADGED